MKRFQWIWMLLIITGCASDDFEPGLDYYSYFDFINGLQNWEADAGNYDHELENTFNFELLHQQSFVDGASKNAMELRLSKVPDQTFVYLRNKIKGLKPATRYQVTFEIQQKYNFTSGISLPDAPDTIYYEAGFSNVKPESILAEAYASNKVVLNIKMPDPGIKYSTITIMDNLNQQNYGLRTLDNYYNPLIITTNSEGEFWFIYGSNIQDISTFSILFDTIIIYYEEI